MAALPLAAQVEALGNPYLLRIRPQVCQDCGEPSIWWLVNPPKGRRRKREVLGKFCDAHVPYLAQRLGRAQE